jgi:hypothetical protein
MPANTFREKAYPLCISRRLEDSRDPNISSLKVRIMAKYGKKAGEKVERAMHEMKEGKLKSGRSGKTVKSRKQAIAIGLSEAREAGAKVPKKKSANKKTAPKKSR